MGPIVTNLRAGIAAFFAWWFGELGGLIPGPIRRLLQGGGDDALIIDISDGIVIRRQGGGSAVEFGRVAASPSDPASEALEISRLLGRANRRGRRLVLRLPGGDALRKTLDLPIAAAENLRQVLSFEMDRQTPFTAAQVYFDYRIIQRDTADGRLKVELTAVPRADVEAAIRRAAAWAIEPDAVDIATDDPGAAPAINLLPGGVIHETRRVGAVTIALLATALLLAVALVAVPLERDRRQAKLLTARVEQARVAALIAAKARDEIERRTLENEFLSVRRRNTPKSVDILNELTRLIPDHTWLQQLRLREKDVRLTGLSGGASGLVRVIEQSRYFSDARFRAPVTQDTRSGKERFTLSAKVVSK